MVDESGRCISTANADRSCLGVTMNYDGQGASFKPRFSLCDNPRSVLVQRFHPDDSPGSGAFCMCILVELARMQGAEEITIRPRPGGIIALLNALGFERGVSDNIYRKQL